MNNCVGAEGGFLMDTPAKKITQDRQDEAWLFNDLATRRVGYALVAAMVVIVGGWSAFAPIQSAALAVGVVQVKGNRQPVQHLEGGIVSKILVSNGDWVEAGQSLLLLDATSDHAERDILQGRLFNTRSQLDRLQAERDDSSKISFSDALIESGNTDQRALNAIVNEQSLFEARLADRKGEEEVIQSRRRGLSVVATSKRQVEKSLSSEVADLSELLVDGYVDKQRIRQLERDRTQLVGELADLEVSIDEAELQILQLRKKFKTQVVDDISRVQEELYDLRQRYAATNDRVTRATIKAPVSGTVLDLSLNTIGAVISPGESLLEIVPQTSDFIIEARISPMDIDRVSVGQSAEVRFSVFKDAYLVSGVLTKLSADRIIDDGSDLPYYEAEIQLVEQDLVFLEGMQLVPGMPAEILIKTGERTMLGYLTSPMNRLATRSLIED